MAKKESAATKTAKIRSHGRANKITRSSAQDFSGSSKTTDGQSRFKNRTGDFDFAVTPATHEVKPPLKKAAETRRQAFDAEQQADRIVRSHFGHAGLIVTEDLEILHFRGDTSPYLRPASGKASFNLLRLIRSELAVELRALIHRAKKQNMPASVKSVSWGDGREVALEVVPLAAPNSKQCLLVLFQDARRGAPPEREATEAKRKTGKFRDREAAPLKRDLIATRNHLRAIIEEQEATNEELKSANEEAVTANEELQSANEQLESAQEELQSSNEELMTLNEQLQNRNTELTLLGDDLYNLFAGLHIPIILLGRDQRIRRFSPAAEKLFNLLAGDAGRPINNIRPNVKVPDLDRLISDVITFDRLEEREVQDAAGTWYDMRIWPYRKIEGGIDGALIVFVDINAVKHSLQQAQEARDYADAIIETVREPLLVLDSQLRVVTANQAFYETFRVSPAETEQRAIYELGTGQWNIPQLRLLLDDVLPQDHRFEGFEVSADFPKIGRRAIVLNARQIYRGSAATQLILLVMEDITEAKTAAQALQVEHDFVSAIVDTVGALVLVADCDGRIVSFNRTCQEVSGYSFEEVKGKRAWDALCVEDESEIVKAIFASLVEGQFPSRNENSWRTKDGRSRLIAWASTCLTDEKGRVTHVIRTGLDVTEQRKTQEEVRTREAKFRGLLEAAPDAVVGVDAQGRIVLVNAQTEKVFGYGRQEILGKPIETLIPKQLRGRHKAHRSVYFGGPQSRPMGTGLDLQGLRKNGSQFPVEISLSPIETGEGILVTATIRDITDRKQAENALRESEAALRRSEEQLRALTAGLLSAQEEERRRISRELHDDLNQKLAMLAVEAEKLEIGLPASPDLIRRQLRLFRERAADLSDDVRNTAYRLHPSALEHLGLVVALRSYCQEFRKLEGIAVKFTSRAIPHEIPQVVALYLYRVAQESLRNVVKHSGAKAATVALAGVDSSVRLIVSDDGAGFDLEAAKDRGGLGLVSMVERARLVNGTLDITTRPGGGTRITLQVPLHPAPAAAG